MKTVTVIIPAYNEQQGIGNTLDELLQSIPDNYEIIVVDDGSEDDTYDIVHKINNKKVRLLKHKYNRGYGSAIKTASKVAKGDILVWYDADGQHRPSDLISVIDKIMEEDLDYCIGVRTSASHVDKNRKLGKRLLSFVANFLAKEPMEDVNSGLRAFKRSVLLRHINLLPDRFGASTVTSFIMQEMDYNGGTVPITVRKREGTSTVKPLKDGMATIRLILNIILLFRAKQVFTATAIVLLLIGTAYGIWSAIVQGLGIPVLSAIVILFGIQMYFFGIISAQISALRLENVDYDQKS